MRQARDLGFSPRTVLDGGAFRGLWSKQAAEVFPGAQIVVVEPNPALQKIIAGNVAGIDPAPIVVPSALGESPGSALFNIWGRADSDQGASLLDHVSGRAGQVGSLQSLLIPSHIWRAPGKTAGSLSLQSSAQLSAPSASESTEQAWGSERRSVITRSN